MRRLACLTALVAPGSLLAQQGAVPDEPVPQPAEGRLVIDLLPDADKARRAEQCDDDAARIAGEIVVCRALGEESDGAFDKKDFERRYGAATQGDKNPNVDGSGIKLPTEGSIATITVTMKMGDPPPGPLMIDVEALPEAPPGSDAERAARGLPPRGD